MMNLQLLSDQKTSVEEIRQSLAGHDAKAVALMRDATHHLECARDLAMKLQQLERLDGVHAERVG